MSVGPELSLAEEVAWTFPAHNESRLHFLGKLQLIANNRPYDAVLPSQFDAITEQLPDWSLQAWDDIILGERRTEIARLGLKISDYKSDRRDLRLTRPDNVILLAKTVLLGEDLCTIFDIEKVRHWTRILERTGADNRYRAYLMLKRDKLI